jgi:predicted RNase H-like nuclease
MEMENELKELIEHIENVTNTAIKKQDWDAIYTLRNITQQMDEKYLKKDHDNVMDLTCKLVDEYYFLKRSLVCLI